MISILHLSSCLLYNANIFNPRCDGIVYVDVPTAHDAVFPSLRSTQSTHTQPMAPFVFVQLSVIVEYFISGNNSTISDPDSLATRPCINSPN